MPAFHRSFNPYSAAPPPPASLPHYTISPSTIEPLTNEEAGSLIDTFLRTQDGKVLTLHRLADYLLGRTQTGDDGEVEDLEHVLEEERRREGGVVQVQLDEVEVIAVERKDEIGEVPIIGADKKRARKEERRLKKEKEREKRKGEEKDREHVKKQKKEKEHKRKH
jgi:hypothetical protein